MNVFFSFLLVKLLYQEFSLTISASQAMDHSSNVAVHFLVDFSWMGIVGFPGTAEMSEPQNTFNVNARGSELAGQVEKLFKFICRCFQQQGYSKMDGL